MRSQGVRFASTGRALGRAAMAHILHEWANGFGLSRPVRSEADLANGYLLAELLAKHNQLRFSSGPLLASTSAGSPASSPGGRTLGSTRGGPGGGGGGHPAAAGPFKDTERVEDATHNFAALLPTLQRLGVKCSAVQVQEIVRAKPGSANRLLYDVYSRMTAEVVRVGRGSEDVPKPLVQAQVRAIGSICAW